MVRFREPRTPNPEPKNPGTSEPRNPGTYNSRLSVLTMSFNSGYRSTISVG